MLKLIAHCRPVDAVYVFAGMLTLAAFLAGCDPADDLVAENRFPHFVDVRERFTDPAVQKPVDDRLGNVPKGAVERFRCAASYKGGAVPYLVFTDPRGHTVATGSGSHARITHPDSHTWRVIVGP